jgi:cytoskeletal protein CcmA (bactofilin family)
MEGIREFATVIGKGTHIKGEMAFDSDAVILGSFEGRITTKGQIHVAEGATCKAAIEGATVVIDGLVEGPVVGTKRVLINASARVVGDIVAPSLAMAPGACIEGLCRIGESELGELRAARTEEPVSRSHQLNGAGH